MENQEPQSQGEFAPQAPKSKNKWKAVGILLTVISLLLATTTTILAVNYFSGGSEAETSSSTEGPKPDLEETQRYLSHTTEYGKLTFDYPDNWNISIKNWEGLGGEVGSTTTAITTKNGYRIFLTETWGGGMGGMCLPEESPELTITKEATGKFPGATVVSFNDVLDEDRFFLGLSTFSGPFDVAINHCDQYMNEFLMDEDSLLANMVFTFNNQDGSEEGVRSVLRPDSEEYSEIVKMLASLRRS